MTDSKTAAAVRVLRSVSEAAASCAVCWTYRETGGAAQNISIADILINLAVGIRQRKFEVPLNVMRARSVHEANMIPVMLELVKCPQKFKEAQAFAAQAHGSE